MGSPFDTHTGERRSEVLDTAPEALWEWLAQLRQQHPSARVGLCLERPAKLGDLHRFGSARQLMGYLGVVRSEDSTGDERHEFGRRDIPVLTLKISFSAPFAGGGNHLQNCVQRLILGGGGDDFDQFAGIAKGQKASGKFLRKQAQQVGGGLKRLTGLFAGENDFLLCHRAYAKHAEVTVPSLDDWEKEWEKNSQRNSQRRLLPVDSQSLIVSSAC